MTNVRLGIIGLGNIGQHHAAYLSGGKINRAELVAVSDAFPAKLEKYSNLKTFTEGEDLIRSGLVDAVVIATPITNTRRWASRPSSRGCMPWSKNPSRPTKRTRNG